MGITGASGVIYGIRFLEAAKNLGVETHLILSDWGSRNIEIETTLTGDYVRSMASKLYNDSDMEAAISSGSFKTDGMVIVPCSMKTLASIANGFDDSLVSRAAGVCLKESRKLVLVPRETPLSAIHLGNMLKISSAGAVILPAMPGFYHRPKTLDDLINHVIGKILDQFGVRHELFKRWG